MEVDYMKYHLIMILSYISLALLPAVSTCAEETPKKIEKQVALRFSVQIDDFTVGNLMTSIDVLRKQGTTDFIIMISTQGGTIHAGLTAYNYLKAMPSPVTVTTHNFGSVDSIGVVMYCAGSKRLSVPQARFLIHGVKIGISGPKELEENSVEELLKKIKIDSRNIANVIALTTNKSVSDVEKAMSERITLDPEEAKAWGLVHEIKSQLYDSTTPVYVIEATPKK
jgi:ATP-dependent protease ClpP protease subunit